MPMPLPTFQFFLNKITDSAPNSDIIYEQLKLKFGFSFRLKESIPNPAVALQTIFKIDNLDCKKPLCKFLDREIQFWLDKNRNCRVDYNLSNAEFTAFDYWLRTNLPRRGFKFNIFNPSGNGYDNNLNHPHNPPPKSS